MVTSNLNEDVIMNDVNGSDNENNDKDKDDLSKAECSIVFVVDNLSELRDTVLSEASYARNLPWKLMAMPRISQEKGNVKCLGVFLQANGESENLSWSCNANAMLGIKCHNGENFERKIQHMFYSKENDWGYSHFINWTELMDEEKGYISDNKITLTAQVSADAPHGFSWDSRKHTGYVGLKNQGATCYMNSLLQTLFFTNKLRKAVYLMPTETEDSGKSVPLALQRVFYELQTSDKLVGTKKLTRSFGWETLDVFMQHDVQELSRVLLDNIEIKMKGTCVDGSIPKLFEGKMMSFVNCKHIDFSSNRNELFYDIQVNIKGKKDILESLKDYITFEPLDGDNKYDAGEHGLQDAEKGVKFLHFPPVLHFQLMRFQYDPATDSNVKINDRFEFQATLDLDPFLEVSNPDDPAIYKLHAVLVHSGDNHGGHYVVYINPKGDGKWCKFDDDVVSKCSQKDAMDNNFGGALGDEDSLSKQSTNAYMLVYIRLNQIDAILNTDVEIPDSLKERLNQEKETEKSMEANRRREKNEAHLYTSVRVILECEFYAHDTNDLFVPDTAHYKYLKVKRSITLTDFHNLIAQEFNVHPDKCRIWNMSHRSNSTYRPTTVIPIDNQDSMLQESLDMDVTFITLFLEVVQVDTVGYVLPMYDPSVEAIIFFKFYDPKSSQLSYVGHSYIKYNATIESLIPMLRNMMSLPENAQLTLFEEVKPGLTNQIAHEKYSYTMHDSIADFMAGDIIVFQEDIGNNPHGYDKPTAANYFNEIHQSIDVVLSDKSVADDAGFKFKLNKNIPFPEFVDAISKRLDIDPRRLQFFKAYLQSYHTSPSSAIKCNFTGCLRDIFMSYKPKQVNRLYYEQVNIEVAELETKKQTHCVWFNSKHKETEIILYPSISGTVDDILIEARKELEGELEVGKSGILRLVEVIGHKIHFLHHATSILDISINSNLNRQFRIEEIPLDQLELQNDQLLVAVVHYQKEIYATFGAPFFIKITQGQSYNEVFENIREILDIPAKDFEKYKLNIISQNREISINIDTQTVKLSHFARDNSYNFSSTPWLGLDHINKQPKRRYNAEKPIKIHN